MSACGRWVKMVQRNYGMLHVGPSFVQNALFLDLGYPGAHFELDEQFESEIRKKGLEEGPLAHTTEQINHLRMPPTSPPPPKKATTNASSAPLPRAGHWGGGGQGTAHLQLSAMWNTSPVPHAQDRTGLCGAPLARAAPPGRQGPGLNCNVPFWFCVKGGGVEVRKFPQSFHNCLLPVPSRACWCPVCPLCRGVAL